MSTPEQPATPPLTRRQLREIRNTGATPIVDVSGAASHGVEEDTFVGSGPQPDAEATVDASPEVETPPAAAAAAPSAPLPRAATPVAVPPAPEPDSSVDLGVSPLTRRQARQQERIRTASVPVISPDTSAPAAAVLVEDDQVHSAAHADDAAIDGDLGTGERPVVAPEFGAELLAGEPVKAELPATFDQLLTRDTSSTGSIAAPNALILTQTPTAALTGPIAATGEVLVTGTYELPDGLGSTGHATGTADGHEADAVLIDGELPAHSSPTPIAASAAVSTIKNDGEIIRPPAPEKSGRTVFTLAIVAGVLLAAAVVVFAVALASGAFS